MPWNLEISCYYNFKYTIQNSAYNGYFYNKDWTVTIKNGLWKVIGSNTLFKLYYKTGDFIIINTITNNTKPKLIINKILQVTNVTLIVCQNMFSINLSSLPNLSYYSTIRYFSINQFGNVGNNTNNL